MAPHRAGRDCWLMEIDQYVIGRGLILVALIAGTIEYLEIIVRRTRRRRADADRRLADDVGLRGLVRVMLIGK
jgi:hypothetical protein